MSQDDFASAGNLMDYQDEMIAIALREKINRDISSPGSTLSKILQRGEKDAIAAMSALIGADLFSRDGIAIARALQNQVLRFIDLVTWTQDLLDDGDRADQNLRHMVGGELDDEEQELMEKVNGTKDQRFDDA